MSSSVPGDTLVKMLPDAYGCVVANRFGELLDDDADPFDMISAVEKEEEKKKKKKQQQQEDERKGKQKKPGQRESQKDRRVPRAPESQEPAPVQKQQQQQQQQARPGPVTENREEAQRGMKRGAAGERRANLEEKPQEYSISKPPSYADSDLRGRGGLRGRRGARGGGYTRNPDNFNLRGKREYDRHNGTGISPEEKRGGRGPWNWGCVEEATSELMEVTSNVPVKAEEPQITVDEENQNLATEEDDGEMVVHVAMEMTLDEWKAMQEISRPKVEFNIRKSENKIPSKAKVIHQSKHPEATHRPRRAHEAAAEYYLPDMGQHKPKPFGYIGRGQSTILSRGDTQPSMALFTLAQLMWKQRGKTNLLGFFLFRSLWGISTLCWNTLKSWLVTCYSCTATLIC